METKKILNLIAFILTIAGAISRILHLPVDGMIYTLSGFLIIIIIFLYSVKGNKELGMSNITNYFLSVALAIAVISASLSGMQKFGAFFIVAISFIINMVLILNLIFSNKSITISKQYMITVFLYICLISSIIAIQELENFKEFIGMLISK